VYVLIDNQGNEADRLLGASSAAAEVVEIHESFMENNVMKMRMLEAGIEIPANGKVELKPGGYHIMLINLAKALEPGTRITVTLKFEKSGDVALDVEIRAQ
jgi:copper(I)-binding protein